MVWSHGATSLCVSLTVQEVSFEHQAPCNLSPDCSSFLSHGLARRSEGELGNYIALKRPAIGSNAIWNPNDHHAVREFAAPQFSCAAGLVVGASGLRLVPTVLNGQRGSLRISGI